MVFLLFDAVQTPLMFSKPDLHTHLFDEHSEFARELHALAEFSEQRQSCSRTLQDIPERKQIRCRYISVFH